MRFDNKETFRRYMEMWVTGDVSRLDEVIHSGYVGHSGGDPDRDESIAELREHMKTYHVKNPGVEVSIDDQVAEEDRVATRMTARSTNPNTGERWVGAGFNISRFAEGKIIEEWALWERP